ncbi:unnamed protein product [Lymnaea stagnalis]|uniref:Tetraspanin n=1 Tax=Lymnaea stagnalis TaxID=6523 RepID=A0AAV2HQ54_LYMST
MACAAIAKCILVLLNVLFLLIGLALMAVGALLAFVPGTILKSLYDTAKSAAAAGSYSFPKEANDMKDMPMIYEVGLALFVLGIILSILSFLGCCGSCCSCCKFLLILFAIVMACLMIGEIVICSLFYVKDSPLHSNIRTTLKDKITNEYKENGTDVFSQSMNLVHRYFECCGIDGGSDFGTKLHRSCDPTNETKGCYTKLTNIIQDNIIWCGLGLAGVLAFQLLEIIFAVIIFKDNKIFPV